MYTQRKPSPLPTCKIPQVESKLYKAVKRELARLSLYTIMSVSLTVYAAYPLVQSKIEASKDEARVEALTSFNANWRERITKEHDLIRPVCNTWWFGMTTKERKVK